MDGFYQGVLGGLIPAVVMVFVYFISMAGRLAKIETHVFWIIEELKRCRLPSKDRSA